VNPELGKTMGIRSGMMGLSLLFPFTRRRENERKGEEK
jgi:hypothetical protein